MLTGLFPRLGHCRRRRSASNASMLSHGYVEALFSDDPNRNHPGITHLWNLTRHVRLASCGFPFIDTQCQEGITHTQHNTTIISFSRLYYDRICIRYVCFSPIATRSVVILCHHLHSHSLSLSVQHSSPPSTPRREKKMNGRSGREEVHTMMMMTEEPLLLSLSHTHTWRERKGD